MKGCPHFKGILGRGVPLYRKEIYERLELSQAHIPRTLHDISGVPCYSRYAVCDVATLTYIEHARACAIKPT